MKYVQRCGARGKQQSTVRAPRVTISGSQSPPLQARGMQRGETRALSWTRRALGAWQGDPAHSWGLTPMVIIPGGTMEGPHGTCLPSRLPSVRLPGRDTGGLGNMRHQEPTAGTDGQDVWSRKRTGSSNTLGLWDWAWLAVGAVNRSES